jgi:hypothetical protein
MTRTYDPKCFELATEFLPEHATLAQVSQLAATIQDTIEDWLEYEQRELELKHEAGDQRAK